MWLMTTTIKYYVIFICSHNINVFYAKSIWTVCPSHITQLGLQLSSSWLWETLIWLSSKVKFSLNCIWTNLHKWLAGYGWAVQVFCIDWNIWNFFEDFFHQKFNHLILSFISLDKRSSKFKHQDYHIEPCCINWMSNVSPWHHSYLLN